jgi:hypothetical protein
MLSGLIILAFAVYFYFLPYWLCVRNFPEEYWRPVLRWNFWIGWTVVGWFGLLLWELVTYPRLVREHHQSRALKERRCREARARTDAASAAPHLLPDGSPNLDGTREWIDALSNEIAVTTEDWF